MSRKRISPFFVAAGMCVALSVAVSPEPSLVAKATGTVSTIADTDFEGGSLSGWDKGSQSGSLTSTITGGGSGVSLINGTVTFNAPSHGAVGSPTLGDGSSNPYYQPAVSPAVWSFSPYGSYGVALQPNGQVMFDSALAALGVSSADSTEMKAELTQQAADSGYGSGTPTDAAWIAKTVTLEAGITYTMSWNYIGTDYVPFNDGSITSLVPVTGSATISVNNSGKQYALLGFTNPGTGDYSTGTFGSTGWQMSTYTVSASGDYVLGFAVFNLDDTALSPVLLIDSQPGSTLKNGESFGAVAPNNPDAPVVTTAPPATDPPATDPPVTDAPVETDPPVTDAPVETDPPVTDAPVETDPPITDAPAETDPPTTEPDPEPVDDENYDPRPETTTTTSTTTTTVAPETTTTVTTEAPGGTETTVMPSPTDGSGSLPNTGSNTNVLLLVASLLVALGLIVRRLEKTDGE